MEIRQLQLQHLLVAAIREGDMLAVNETQEEILWQCIGVFESASMNEPDGATTREEEMNIPLN